MHYRPLFNAAAALLLTAACLAFGAGCAQRYIITTTTGAKVVTASKPRLVESNYVFKDANGNQIQMSKLRVRVIEPYSKQAAGMNPTVPDLR